MPLLFKFPPWKDWRKFLFGTFGFLLRMLPHFTVSPFPSGDTNKTNQMGLDPGPEHQWGPQGAFVPGIVGAERPG